MNLLKYMVLNAEVYKEDSEKDEKASCPEGQVPAYINQKTDYSKCYNKDGRYERLFYNDNFNMFFPCYENCKYCDKGGSRDENNCLECDPGYTKDPKDEKGLTCVIQCQYNFYYGLNHIYSCTPGPSCPKEYTYYIPDRKECIDECKNDKEFSILLT